MSIAIEVVSAYATGTAAKAPLTFSGHIDAALMLVTATTVTIDGQSNAIDIEGGDVECAWYIAIGTVTGATFTFLESIQCSIDGGSNYYKLMTMPLLDINDANQQIGRLVYIPRPNSSNRFVKVRIDHDVTNTTSVVMTSFLRPVGDGMDRGLEYLT